MAILNERNENTKGIIHLLTTTLCNRDCKYCCNKQYDMNEIPYVTDSELSEAHTLCLTGGEPFLYTNPCTIAKHYKLRYRNLQNVYVYTNALELAQWLQTHTLHDLDGLNISIKTKADAKAFEHILKNHIDVLYPVICCIFLMTYTLLTPSKVFKFSDANGSLTLSLLMIPFSAGAKKVSKTY